jgi:hypothetical protein
MQQAAQGMTPIDTACAVIACLLSVLLPQFVGEEESDDQQGQHEKRAKYQTLDHDGLPCDEKSSDDETHFKRVR